MKDEGGRKKEKDIHLFPFHPSAFILHPFFYPLLDPRTISNLGYISPDSALVAN